LATEWGYYFGRGTRLPGYSKIWDSRRKGGFKKEGRGGQEISGIGTEVTWEGGKRHPFERAENMQYGGVGV